MSTARRRFTMLDGMILIAASAVGFWLTRWMAPGMNWEQLPGQIWGLLQNPPRTGWSLRYLLGVIAELSALAIPSLLAWTLALPILRFRGPRPPWRRVWRQPGLVACAWIVLTLLGEAALGAAIVLASKSRAILRGMDAEVLIIFGLVMCGLAVVVAWTTLILSRGWRCERSWIDRLGRVLGLAWIGYAALGVAVLFYLT